MKSVTYLLFSIICVTILSACGEKSASANGVTQSIDATLQEITSGIESGRWESARVKAENLYTVQHNNLSPIEAAKLTIIYISHLWAGIELRAIPHLCSTYRWAARLRHCRRFCNRNKLFQDCRRSNNGRRSLRKLPVHHCDKTANRKRQHNHLWLTPAFSTISACFCRIATARHR